jgi:hypothetical protein
VSSAINVDAILILSTVEDTETTRATESYATLIASRDRELSSQSNMAEPHGTGEDAAATTYTVVVDL